MYRLGQPLKHHRTRIVLVLAVLGALGVASVFIFRALHPDTRIGPPSPAKTTIITVDSAPQKFDEQWFTLTLPADWKLSDPYSKPPTSYRFVAAGSTADTRALDVYIDDLPTPRAVNRVLPVQENGAGVTVIGAVSENCVDFVAPNTPIGSGTAPAKWDGISFLCDTAGSLGDLVGIGTTAEDDSLMLSGTTSGAHKVYFTYTDNTGSPDYSYFMDALKTFQLK